jgi:hypothetical protein
LVTTKVNIKYGTFPEEVTVPVIVQKMQDDLKSQYQWKMACPACAGEKYSAIGRKNFCKNSDCEFSAEFPKEQDTLRTLDHKTVYEKAQIDACKEAQGKTLQIVGTIPKDFPRDRIMGCSYVVPNVKEDGAEDRTSFIVMGLRKSDNVLVVSSNRTGTEKLGILAVENGNLVLFDVALDEQIRKQSQKFTLDESEETAKVGAEWINNIPKFDFATMESQTNKNYESLVDGNEIVVETKKTEVKKSAKSMFAIKTAGIVDTKKVEDVVEDKVIPNV